jgi:hypothetical protein
VAIVAIRAYTANLWVDPSHVIEMVDLAEGCLPEDHLVARGMAAYALTVTYYAGDDIDRSIRSALNMLEIGEELTRLLIIVTALCDMVTARELQGQLHQAEHHYGRAHQWLVERNGLDSLVRCAYEAGLADPRFQRSQLDAAHKHALTAIDFCQRLNVPSQLVTSYVALMRVFGAQDDVDSALGALRDAEQVVQIYHLRLATKTSLNTCRVVQ